MLLICCYVVVVSQVAIMELLLEHNADPAVQNRRGDLPLHCAVRQKKVSAVELLIAEQARRGHKCRMHGIRNEAGELPANACKGWDFECVGAWSKAKIASWKQAS
mmetsp:Transcript_31383/g.58524  ORF Transcript_31383/g.58524 Transcript_31383/m.58524 type:complete len:105 (+) Transcript_31383:878-1192(+)